MMRFTRRTLLTATAIAGSVPAFARRKKRKDAIEATPGPFDTIAASLLAHMPETAVYNGTSGSLDGGDLAQRFDDWSPAGEAALRASFRDAQRLLSSIKLRGDSPEALHLSTVSALLENGTRTADIGYGRINPFTFTGHSPYTVSQISGPHIDAFSTMMEQQSLATTRAVDAWLDKLDSAPAAFAGLIEKIRADRATGCVPPRALLEKTLPVLDSMLAGSAGDQPLVRALARRTAEAGLSRRIRQTSERRAALLVQRRLRPAIKAVRDTMAAMLGDARPEAGVWAQPDGEALYAGNVRALGDTTLTPDEIHQIGLDEVARIAAQMNGLLEKQGLQTGSIGARMAALARDPANQFADSDAGRDALLEHVRTIVAKAEASYAEWLPPALIPRNALVVRRVPVATQDSAPGGFYDGPSLDGARPGTFWINLRDMAAVARFRLSTLAYHEGVPGHHTQNAIALSLGEAPLLVRIGSFNAYQEGWALYAERLMAERGAFESDPLGELGWLQDELFRAVRLVVDTGLHHKRWNRELAIRTMRDITGIAETRVVAEVERYMAWPGQALGYKLGQLRLLEMRKRWLARKGRDLKGFHGHVLQRGSVPLDLLESFE